MTCATATRQLQEEQVEHLWRSQLVAAEFPLIMLPVLPSLLPRGRERADFPLVVKSKISAPGVRAFAQQTLKLRRGNCQLLCFLRSHIQHHTPLSSIVFAWSHRRKPAPRLHPFSPGSCLKARTVPCCLFQGCIALPRPSATCG